MRPRLTDFALMALQLLMFKVYRNFGTLKIEFFNYYVSERLQQSQK